MGHKRTNGSTVPLDEGFHSVDSDNKGNFDFLPYSESGFGFGFTATPNFDEIGDMDYDISIKLNIDFWQPIQIKPMPIFKNQEKLGE